MGFLSKFISSIKQATRSRFELNKDRKTLQLLLDTKNEDYFTLEFNEMNVENLYDSSIQSANKIISSNEKLGNLYIETIRLKPKHTWNVSAGSAFDRFIKEQFKSNELTYIDSFDSDFTKLTKYQLNFENELGVIWFNLNYIDIFILDSKGKLFNDLIEIYNINNKNLIIKDIQSEISLQIQGSLTQTNIKEDYFCKEGR